MNLRFIDWIWHVGGSVPLPAGQSAGEAFDRLDPVFHQVGTSHQRSGNTIAFSKVDPAAQDRMAVFDKGLLWIESGAEGTVLRYRLASRALLLCFLAPLLFLAFAQLTIVVNEWRKPAAEAAKTADAAKKPDTTPTLNAIDKALGAPEPDKPGKNGEEGAGRRGKKPSPTPAYVFAGIFAALYVAGRVLESWLVKSLFRKRLLAA